jgi:hypothetical protein
MPSTWVSGRLSDGVRAWTLARRLVRTRPIAVDGLLAIVVGAAVCAGSDSVAEAVAVAS